MPAPGPQRRFNPFPGLRPFLADEDYLFFGREQEIAELLTLLREKRFLGVVGTSGSGKSSLVRAGLLPELLGGGMTGVGSAWEALTMRPGGDPLLNLAKAFCAADLYDRDDEDTVPQLLATLNRSGSGLVEAARQSDLEEGTHLLILVDQFEEIFRLGDRGVSKLDEARAFVRLLLEAAQQNEVPIFVVLTMRSDYLGDCANFTGLAEAVNEGEYLIPRFSRDQLQAAIEGPVKVGGGTIAYRLVQRLLNDVGNAQDQLPVLQHALMRTWDCWESDHEEGEALDLRHYESVGTLTEALSLHADEVHAALPDDRSRELAARVFKALTEKGADNRGIRRPMRFRTLAAVTAGRSAELAAILDAYRAPGVTFLMPGDETELAPETVIDISHESLMRVWQRLRAWVEDEAQSARIYHRLVDTARLWEDGKAGLYHDPDLQIAQSWREANDPTETWAGLYGGGFETAMRFLDASHEAALEEEREKEAARRRELEQARALAEAEGLRVAEQEKGARRLRKLLAAAAVVAVVAVGASIFAARQTRKAKASEAASDALAAELKTTLVQGDWELSYAKLDAGDGGASLAYLGRAMRNDPSFAAAGMRAVSTLASGTIPTQRFAPIEHEDPISVLLHNEKHDVLLTSSDGGREVRLWDFETGEQIAAPTAGPAGDPGGGPSAIVDSPADPAIVARINEDFAGAWKIWLAADPENPPSEPRYFRKSIPIPEGRTPVRADLFIEADDAFELMVDGAKVLSGEGYDKTFQISLEGGAAVDGLDLLVEARNRDGHAGLAAAVFVSFEDGDPLVVVSDESWRSSSEPGTGFVDSVARPLSAYYGTQIETVSRPALSQWAWSVDEDRFLGVAGSFAPSLQAWEAATGRRVGEPVELPGLKSFQVAPLEGPEDIVGCEFSDDGSLQVWNVSAGEPATPRLATGGKVVRWMFTGDGERIVGLFSDSRIGVWETIGGAEVARFDTRPTFADGMHLSQDGRFVAATDDGNRRIVWWEIGVDRGAEAPWIDVPFGFTETRFHSSGDLVSVVGTVGTGNEGVLRAQTWSLADRRLVADITSDRGATSMGMVGGDFAIVGAVNGNVVTIWDLASGEILQRLIAPEILESANLAPDGRRVVAGSATSGTSAVAGSAEKKLFVFDLFAGRIAIPKPIVLGGPSQIFFSPDAETLVTIDPSENAVRFWDLRLGRQVREPVLLSSIRTVTFSRSGSRVALWQVSSAAYGRQSIGQQTGRVFIEQVGVPPALPDFLVERGLGGGWVHSPADGRTWMSWSRRQGDDIGQLAVRDRVSLEVVRTLDVEVGEIHAYFPVVWSEDGGRMAMFKDMLPSERWLARGQVPLAASGVVVDTGTGEVIAALDHDAGFYIAVDISREGTRVAFGGGDGQVNVWSEEEGQATFDPFAGTDPIRVLAFNGDGSLLAVADRTQNNFAIVDSRTGEARIPSTQGESPVDDFAFSPDGRFVIVASAGSSGRIPMFDLATGERVREFELRDWSRMLDLSPDGRVLASGSGSTLEATSGVAYLFEVATGRLLTPPLPAGGTVGEVAFDPRGEILATGTYRTATGFGYAQLWDVATGRALASPIAGRGQVNALSFAPDGGALVVGWSNGEVNLVPVPPRASLSDWLPDLAEAIGDRRLAADTGMLEGVGDEQLAEVRGRLMAGDPSVEPDDPWMPWARWLFEDPRERGVFPGAATSMARHLARLRAGDDIFDLHQAVRWSPGDALTHARLAVLYQRAAPNNLPGPAKRHWEDAAVWFSDRAIALAPDDVEVWTMRADLMRGLKRSGAAAEAAARVLALAPAEGESDSANALYQNALALAEDDKWDEAGEAFGRALELLDDYRGQLDAGEQPLPLLGVLSSFVPTRKAPGVRNAERGEGEWSEEPIEGAFEDFEGTADGQLPEGWRVWNRSDRDAPSHVHHLGNFGTDLWTDWVVVGREKFEVLTTPLPGRVLAEAVKPVVDGVERNLLEGRFALAVSSGRAGNQVQFLESPDFDCTGQSDVHLSFHSAYEAHARGMGIVEYSIDGGANWLPARYFVHQGFLDEARKSGAADAELDLDRLLDTPREQLPWWIGEGGSIVGGNYGAFVSAPRDHPGLADCFEGRPPATDANHLESKRIEGIPLPEANDQASVRLRFGLVASNAGFWAIDDVGLHAGGQAGPEGERDPEAIALTRPAADASVLAKAAMGEAFGREAGTGDWSRVGRQIADAASDLSTGLGSSPDAPDAATGQAPAASDVPIGERLIQARLLAAQALGREDGRTSEVRAYAAAVMLRCLKVDEGWEILTTSDDVVADLSNSEWREAMALTGFLRGLVAAQFGNRDAAYALFTMADQLLEGSAGPRQAVRTALAALETPEDAAERPKDVVLVKRGSPWGYFDEGRLPAEDWNQPEFDDDRWFRGRAPLGYGDDGMATTVQMGPDEDNKFPTTYFRTTFEVDEAVLGKELVLRVRRDDGCVVYLNGTEIARDGMPDGPPTYETFANITVSPADEGRFFTLPVESAPLRAGTNCLAVEVHQTNGNSSDLVFDLELVSTEGSLQRTLAAIAIPKMEEQLEGLGVPAELRAELLRRLVEALAENGEVEALREGTEVVEAILGETGPGGAGKVGFAMLRRLQALVAEAEGDSAAADRLFGEALETIFARVDAAEAFDFRTLPLALREAALLVRRGPADAAFLYQRCRWQNIPEIEKALVLRWARNAAGEDPDALVVLCHALREGELHEEALAIADSVLASLKEPAAGAPASELLRFRGWLRTREKAIRELGRDTLADSVLDEFTATPPRDPALAPECIDLSAHYNGSLFDPRRWPSASRYDLWRLVEAYDAEAVGVSYDLRGLICLNSGKFPEGDRLSDKTVAEYYDLEIPDAVEGIRIGRPAKTVRFMVSASHMRETEGVEIAHFLVHHADGSESRIPIRAVTEVEDWFRGSNNRQPKTKESAARSMDASESSFVLQQITWENPKPGVAIESVDFVSGKAKAAPFLVAITVEE